MALPGDDWCVLLMQEAVDGLIRQMSDLAAPGSRMCFDALHRDHMDGRVHCRGYSCGAQASLCLSPFAYLLTH